MTYITIVCFFCHFIQGGILAQNTCKIDNLIVNGDFEDTSKHCFVFNPVNKLSDMSYPWKGYSMFIWQPLTKLQPFYLDEVDFDHSTNTKNGHYLYIDPRNASAYVWQFNQTVKVEKGKQYTCSLWYSSMNKSGNPEANIRLTVNGVSISPLKKVNNISNFWDSIQGTWNSGTATTAQISLELLNPKVGGNDFAIDDVYFGQGVLIADAGKDSVMCSESEFKLGGNEPASLGASCNAYRYKWTPVNAIDGPSNIAHPKLKKPIQKGDYVLKVSDMNGNECSDTVNISLRKYFQLNFNDSLICDSIKISIPDSIGNVLWNDGSTSHERFLKKSGIYTIQYTGICSIEYDTFVLRRSDEIKSVVKIDNYFCTDDRFKVEIMQKRDPVKWFDEDTAH
ncbi:MAG TPA: carbohydrate binding domain-containing protein, partial [Bacteroidia bacterium]